MWSPTSLILNSFLALYKGLKVLPIASTFRACFVRNFVARMYSFLLNFFDFVRLSFVLSSVVRDNFFHALSTSSMVRLKRESVDGMVRGRKKSEMCFPKPTKK